MALVLVNRRVRFLGHSIVVAPVRKDATSSGCGWLRWSARYPNPLIALKLGDHGPLSADNPPPVLLHRRGNGCPGPSTGQCSANPGSRCVPTSDITADCKVGNNRDHDLSWGFPWDCPTPTLGYEEVGRELPTAPPFVDSSPMSPARCPPARAPPPPLSRSRPSLHPAAATGRRGGGRPQLTKRTDNGGSGKLSFPRPQLKNDGDAP
eukprot:gene17096-biopygen3785